MTEIRPFTDEDREPISTLVVELQHHEQQYDAERVVTEHFAANYVARLLADIKEHKGILLTAVYGHTVCGFVAGFALEEVANQSEIFYISDLVVAEAQRGQGIGSSLIRSVETFAAAQGFKRLGIGVLTGNDRVYRLYRRMGFHDYEIQLIKEL